MATFNELQNTETNTHFKNIFSILAQREPAGMTKDAPEVLTLDESDLEQIKNELYENVRDGLANDGEIQTATEMRSHLLCDTKEQLERYIAEQRHTAELRQTAGIVQDGYANPVSGIGTFIDPGMHTEAFIPVSITPTEATAYYANGGIPERVINKKAGCLTLNDMHFICDAFSAEDLQQLEAYAQKCGFSEAFSEGITQALIFGGAVVYPVLKGDNPLTTAKTTRELLKDISEERNFIKYWVTVDRWNTVFVPEYNITAQDYLYAKTLFIPLGGIKVNTQRCAMIRPKKLPFWAAIRQMGWSTSDFEGWIKDYESYEIMKMSLPIMAQQMSLMYHSFPADGMIIENGPEYARRFMKENEKELRDWSMLNPKAVNSIGEIKILERTYSGFQQLISESRLALCSSSAIPESILFAEKATGLASDNRDDVELKQSETIRLLYKNVAPAFQNCIELLVYSCFGKNSEQAKHAREVRIAPDTGTILNDQDKAQLGQAFTTILGTLSTQIGMPLKQAAEVAKKFVPSAELDDDIMNALEQGESEGIDSDLWNRLNQTPTGEQYEQNF